MQSRHVTSNVIRVVFAFYRL